MIAPVDMETCTAFVDEFSISVFRFKLCKGNYEATRRILFSANITLCLQVV
jgi:hypothetical protein